MLTRDDFYNAAGVTQHAEFEQFLKQSLFDRGARESFYRKLIAIDPQHVRVDTFKPYFEEYAAERKSNMQDYTPDEISLILATITRTQLPAPDQYDGGDYSAADVTAGTGSLLIQKWWDDMICESPWSYVPHRYFYFAQELADNAIPYLLHNLIMRGINAIVVHGDTLERTAKQVYFVQNSRDDYLGFSDLNVMPHSDAIANALGLVEWRQDPIDHIESPLEMVWRTALPSRKKTLKVATAHPKPYDPPSAHLQLKDIADIERAQRGKIYPKGASSTTDKRNSRAVRMAEIAW